MKIGGIRTYISIILIGLGSVSCNRQEQKTKDEPRRENSFKSVYDTLDVINAPLKFEWNNWHRSIERYMEDYGPIKSASLLDNPFAKVFDTKGYKGIVFISNDETGAPTFVTVGKDGNPIDTLFLLGNNSSNDPKWLTLELAEIKEDKTIVLVDSVFHWNLDKAGNRIEGTKILKVEVNRFRISESGRIEKLE